MKNKPNISPLGPIISFLSRYNFVIFIIIVATGLGGAILSLNFTLRIPYDTTSFSNTNNGSITFDETTITRLNQLKTSSENSTNQSLPSGRINPFSE